jgi:hypothetical protein
MLRVGLCASAREVFGEVEVNEQMQPATTQRRLHSGKVRKFNTAITTRMVKRWRRGASIGRTNRSTPLVLHRRPKSLRDPIKV